MFKVIEMLVNLILVKINTSHFQIIQFHWCRLLYIPDLFIIIYIKIPSILLLYIIWISFRVHKVIHLYERQSYHIMNVIVFFLNSHSRNVHWCCYALQAHVQKICCFYTLSPSCFWWIKLILLFHIQRKFSNSAL